MNSWITKEINMDYLNSQLTQAFVDQCAENGVRILKRGSITWKNGYLVISNWSIDGSESPTRLAADFISAAQKRCDEILNDV
jgi:hypothetical protein